MKQQQQLVFGDAPSDVINKKQAKRKNAETEPCLQCKTSSVSQSEAVVRDSPKENKDKMKKNHLPFSSKIKQTPQKETKHENGRLR